MILYLSGPMRGHPSFNFPLFDSVAKSLRSQGYGVMNPAAHDRDLYANIEEWPGFETGDPEQCPQFNLPKSLAWDFQTILDCDGIALLPGWERSSGARAERFVAECVGKEVWRVFRHEEGDYYVILHQVQMMDFPQLKQEVRSEQAA